MKSLNLIAVAIATCSVSLVAIAQTTVNYTSPIVDYQPYIDEKVASWKVSNDKVGQIGGWRAYAKEAQQPDNMSTPAQSSTPKTGNAAPVNSNEGRKQ